MSKLCLSPYSGIDLVSAYAALQELSLDEFLAGTDREDPEIDVDDIFAGTFDDALRDYLVDSGFKDTSHFPHRAPLGRSDGDIVYLNAVDVDLVTSHGIAAWSTKAGCLVGLYTGCTLAVDPEFRGIGIGTNLVKLRFLCNEELPLWYLDEASFSNAGLSVHQGAYEELCDMAELHSKEHLASS